MHDRLPLPKRARRRKQLGVEPLNSRCHAAVSGSSAKTGPASVAAWIGIFLLCEGAAFAQTTTSVTIAVDATAAGTPLEPIWAFHGYDECNYTTTVDGKALLQTLGMIPPTPPHIRTHFLLNTGNGVPSFKWGSTNVYTTDAMGNPVYDWTLMDGIMDTITGAGAFPYVEIGFMPEALSTHPTPYQNSTITALDGGCFYPPTDYTKWADLIQEWATHSNTRYKGVASTWQWELWNEPDNTYWHGTPAEYDQLYDYTESALHQVLPDAPLGGPATAGVGSFLTQFLQHCATGKNAVTGATGTRLDLVSFHAKGGVATVGGNAEMDLGHQLQLHSNGFNAVAGFPQFKQTPIVISEADPDGCAACIETQPSYRTSPAYGVYEVAMMKRTLELESNIGVNVRGVLAWAFLFENQPLFAAYRVLASNGIDLPVLNAFKLLGSLNGDTIPVTSSGALPLASILANSVRAQPDIDAMATRNGQQIQVLVWNYHDELVTVATSPVSLQIQVPTSFGTQATVNHLRVDETHGDAYTAWVSQGSPATPSPAQLAALQQAMVPAPLQPEETVAVTAGAVTLDFDLPRFGLSLITVSATNALDASTEAASSTEAEAGLGDGAASLADATSASRPDATSEGTADATPADGATGPSTGQSADAGGNSQGSVTPGHSAGCGCSVGPTKELAPRVPLILLAGTALLRRRFLLRRRPRQTD
jgi:xylan 1,4-beta-xylosidase